MKIIVKVELHKEEDALPFGKTITWEFEFHSGKNEPLLFMSNYVTMAMLRNASVVKIDGETVKDRLHTPVRRMTIEEISMLGS